VLQPDSFRQNYSTGGFLVAGVSGFLFTGGVSGFLFPVAG
jgi:hypothetical protein